LKAIIHLIGYEGKMEEREENLKERIQWMWDGDGWAYKTEQLAKGIKKMSWNGEGGGRERIYF